MNKYMCLCIIAWAFLTSNIGSASPWQPIKFDHQNSGTSHLVSITQPATDFLLQVENQLDVEPINPPGARGLNTWLMLTATNQTGISSWHIKPAYQVTKSVNYQIKSLSLIEENESEKWIQNIAQTNSQWSKSSFLEKQKWVKELHQSMPVEQGKSWYVDGLLQLLYMYFELGENNIVIELLTETRDLPDSSIQHWHFQWLKAESYLNLGQFPQAMATFAPLIQSVESTDELSKAWHLNLIEIKASAFMAQSLFAFYIQQSSLPDNGEIIDVLDQAIISGDSILISDVLYAQAINQVMHNNMAESIALLDLAIELLTDAGAIKNIYLFYHQKAVTYYMFNQLDLAILNYRKSLVLVNENDRPLYWSGLHVSIAKVYRLLGEYKPAQRYAGLAKSYYMDNNLLNELALVQQLLGRLANDNGEYVTAIDYHQKAMNYFSKHNEKLNIVNMLALAANHQALKQKVVAQDRALMAWIQQVKFLNHHQKVNDKIFNISSPFTDQSRDLMLEKLTQLPLIWDEVITEAALVLYDLTSDKRLELFLQKLVPIYSLSEANDTVTVNSWDVDLQLELFTVMLNIYKSQKNAKAISHLSEHAFSLINNTHDQFLGTDTALYWSEQSQKFIDSYVIYLLHAGRDEQAYLVLEQQQSNNWRKRKYQSNQGNAYQNNSQLYQAYIKVVKETVLNGQSPAMLENVDKKRELFAHSLQQSSMGSVDELDDFQPMRIAQLQKHLSSNEVAIRYVFNTEPHVFMISKDKWVIHTLTNLSDLNKLSQKLVQSIQKKDLNYMSHAHRLSQALLLNASILTGKKRLVVVTDGVLSAVPFSTLSSAINLEDYRPLVMDFDLIQTPSLSTFYNPDSSIESKSNVGYQTATVISNPVFLNEVMRNKTDVDQYRQLEVSSKSLLAGFQMLPQTAREASMIEQHLKPLKVVPLSRSAATTANILSSKTKQSDIIHLATHGYFANESFDHVGLATTVESINGQLRGGFLSLREIFAHNFSAKLVVLSGCETMLGTQIDGEGMISLTRGFLAQGVNAVVSSIWSVPDPVTPDFMGEFYKEFSSNDYDIPNALSEAQRRFLNNKKYQNYKHPYFWAGFVLTKAEK